jgi:hypothetical protein
MREPNDYWPRVKRWLKVNRWYARRVFVSIRWGTEALAKTPVVLGNAMPKSGSHLIIQVLRGLTRLGPFIDPGFPPVNRDEANCKLPDEAILKNILRMRHGDIGYGYIQAHQPFIEALTRPGMASIFVYRDPRDMIISHVFYATEMYQGHGMHNYYTEVLGSMEERINAAIQGVEEDGAELSSVREKYSNYLGWLDISGVLCIRFETIIQDQDQALGSLIDYLESRGFSLNSSHLEAVHTLKASIAPRKSGTFRKGQPGNWREHFTPANKALFKDVAGELLIQLGYERDNNW